VILGRFVGALVAASPTRIPAAVEDGAEVPTGAFELVGHLGGELLVGGFDDGEVVEAAVPESVDHRVVGAVGARPEARRLLVSSGLFGGFGGDDGLDVGEEFSGDVVELPRSARTYRRAASLAGGSA
jgi:hypothetical protein